MSFLVNPVVVGDVEPVGESLERGYVGESIDPVAVGLRVMRVVKSAVCRVRVLVAVDVRNIVAVLVVDL